MQNRNNQFSTVSSPLAVMTAAVAATLVVTGSETATISFRSGPCCLHPNDVAACKDGRLGTKRFHSGPLACFRDPYSDFFGLALPMSGCTEAWPASGLAIVTPLSSRVDY